MFRVKFHGFESSILGFRVLRARFQNLKRVLRHRLCCSNGDFRSIFVKFRFKMPSKNRFPNEKTKCVQSLDKFVVRASNENVFVIGLTKQSCAGAAAVVVVFCMHVQV